MIFLCFCFLALLAPSSASSRLNVKKFPAVRKTSNLPIFNEFSFYQGLQRAFPQAFDRVFPHTAPAHQRAPSPKPRYRVRGGGGENDDESSTEDLYTMRRARAPSRDREHESSYYYSSEADHSYSLEAGSGSSN